MTNNIDYAVREMKKAFKALDTGDAKLANKITVRILGHEAKVGTKRYTELVAQKKHFDDLARFEN